MTWIVSAVVEAIAHESVQSSNSAMIIHAFVLAVLLIFWASLHAEAKQVEVSKGALLFVGLFPLLGLPYYLLSRIGLRAGAKKALLAFGLLVACVFAYSISFEITWWIIN